MQPNDSLENWRSVRAYGCTAGRLEQLEWQLKNRITKLENESRLALTNAERAGCELAGQKLALAITPYFFNLIDPNDPNDPIRRQIVPQGAEHKTAPEELLDPVGEDEHQPVRALSTAIRTECFSL